MRPKKFHFAPINMEKVKATSDEKTLAIYKSGQMIISKVAVREYGLNGSLIDFRFDKATRAFGFKKIAQLPQGSWTRTMRLLTADEKTGAIKVPVGRVLTAVGIEKGNYTGLTIEKYNDVMEDREIYYVIIPNTTKDEKTEDNEA